MAGASQPRSCKQRKKPGGIDRLDEVVRELRRLGALTVFSLAISGNGDQYCIGGLGKSAQPAGQRITVHARHADVDQHDLRSDAGGMLQRLCAVMFDRYAMAVCLEQQGKAIDRIDVIVYQQNARPAAWLCGQVDMSPRGLADQSCVLTRMPSSPLLSSQARSFISAVTLVR